MTGSLNRAAISKTRLALIIWVATLAVGCDSSSPRSSYYEVEPGANFSQWQLQCTINAIEQQREVNKEMQNWQKCESDLPRLTQLQERLRQEWKAKRYAEWETRCAKEIVSLKAVCLKKQQEAPDDLPGYLRLPPVYTHIDLGRSIEVTPRYWRRAKTETDLKQAAARIVMERVEADSKMSSSLSIPQSGSTTVRMERSQEEEDKSDLIIGWSCSKWIGREPPDGNLITEEYLDRQIATCESDYRSGVKLADDG